MGRGTRLWMGVRDGREGFGGGGKEHGDGEREGMRGREGWGSGDGERCGCDGKARHEVIDWMYG